MINSHYLEKSKRLAPRLLTALHGLRIDHGLSCVDYLPFSAHVEDGWQHPARIRVALGGEPSSHSSHLWDYYPIRVFSSFLSPLGLGLVEFGLSIMRQTMLEVSPIEYDAVSMLRVVKHDEAGNLRACQYERESCIMFLSFLLDY